MEFDRNYFGHQGKSADDAKNSGSLYSEVRSEMFRNAYYLGERPAPFAPLPTYEVNWSRVAKGLFSFGRQWLFRQAAERAVDSDADLRWGDNRRGFRRLLHPNGVCLFGRWLIDCDNPWSGYFRKGSEALIIGRYSTCCTETRRGFNRSLSLVGKLFPTNDEHHTDAVKTANFITQEDLGGSKTSYMNDVTLTNAPNVTPWRRGFGAPILLLSGLLFKIVDREPAIRQLYTVAELTAPGQSAVETTVSPNFMRLVVDEAQPRINGASYPDHLDFRHEILQQIYPPDEPAIRRTLTFHIECADQGAIRGLFVKRGVFPDGAWHRIGRITFHEAVCSYNTDFVLHFPHPPWRTNRNRADTTLRRRSDSARDQS
ncbi:MAG: hypothetical protein U0996_25720 [Planctomycetaceae bacterium]